MGVGGSLPTRPRVTSPGQAVRLPVQPLELRREFIARTALFRGVCHEQREVLATQARDRHVPRHGSFYRQEEPAAETCLLVSGRVKLGQLSANGEQVILRLVGPGELFGGFGQPAGGCHSATAEALEDSHALGWERRTLDAMIGTCPPLQQNLLQVLAGQLGAMEDRYRELATECVAQRLSRTLLRLAGHVGRPCESGVLVALSREDLAQMMGSTLYSVSRLVSEWEARGILHARREAVVISALADLARLAEAPPENPRRI